MKQESNIDREVNDEEMFGKEVFDDAIFDKVVFNEEKNILDKQLRVEVKAVNNYANTDFGK